MMNINKTGLIAIVVIGIVAFGAFASVATAWPPNLPQYDECYALVIGISDYMGETEYDDPYGPNAVNDAATFRNELRTTWGMFAPITLLIDQQASEAGIDNAFANVFNGAGPNDLAIVYWNGHAAVGAMGTWDGKIYFDTKLSAEVNAITAGTKIVILDGCHVGSFEDALDIDNTVVLLACESDEGAWLYDYGAPFPFNNYGYAFSHYINQHPDVNSDGVVSIEEVFGYASPRVTALAAEHGESQHPILIDNVPGDVAYLDSWG